MNKLFSFIVVWLCLISSVSSESAKQKELLATISQEICVELETIDYENATSYKVLMQELGLVMLSVVERYNSQVKIYFGIDGTRGDGAKQLGEKLGKELIYKCKYMLKIRNKNTELLESGQM